MKKIMYDGAEYDIINNNQTKEIKFMVGKNIVKNLKMKFIHQVVIKKKIDLNLYIFFITHI